MEPDRGRSSARQSGSLLPEAAAIRALRDVERTRSDTPELRLELPGLDLAPLVDQLAAAVERRVLDHLAAAAAHDEAATTEHWITVAETARRVGVHPRTVYRALVSGALAGERVGSRWRIRPAAVEAWLQPPELATVRQPAPHAHRSTARPRPAAQPASGGSFRARALAAHTDSDTTTGKES